jgi:hypothetical protein
MYEKLFAMNGTPEQIGLSHIVIQWENKTVPNK